MSEQEKEKPAAEKQDTPVLPASYFQELLNTPACKRGEKCDNCGRCER